MSGGYYLMERGWLEHPVLNGREVEPFTRREAWCWLIEAAAYASVERHVRGVGSVHLRRGEAACSHRHLAKTWQWSVGRVQRFLGCLRDEGMVALRAGTESPSESLTGTGCESPITVVSICNYDKYQVRQERTESPREEVVNENRVNKEKEDKEINIPPLTPPVGGITKIGERRNRRERQRPLTRLECEESTWRIRLQRWVDTGCWLVEWGDPPGQPRHYGCCASTYLAVAEIDGFVERRRQKVTPPRRAPQLPLPIAGGRAA